MLYAITLVSCPIEIIHIQNNRNNQNKATPTQLLDGIAGDLKTDSSVYGPKLIPDLSAREKENDILSRKGCSPLSQIPIE